MPVFTYRAADRAGRTVDGMMEAYDANAVVERLHREHFYPLRVEPASEKGRFGRGVFGAPGVPAQEILSFTQQLATLVEAGLPLERALVVLGDVSANRRLRGIVQDVTQSVRAGSTLADALARHHPRPFSRHYVNTVRAGERGGVLEIGLRRLAEHLEATRELREAVVSALIYPALLLVVGTGAVIFLMTFVLPRFAVILADLGQTLPLPTRLMLGASEAIVTYWWAIAGLALVLTLAWQAVARSDAGRLRLDGALLALPIAGEVFRKVEVGRAVRTLGTLLSSGVPLLGALDVAREGAGNRVVANALASVHGGVKRGEGLARPMAETGAFPALVVHMVRVGEETGRLDDMLARVAGAYEREVRVAVRRLVATLEPAIIVVLGAVVLAIVLAILLAILSVNELPL
ncbi:MAG: type II secretion system F family protein [Candidatus Rokuibacteriota bacterium]